MPGQYLGQESCPVPQGNSWGTWGWGWIPLGQGG